MAEPTRTRDTDKDDEQRRREEAQQQSAQLSAGTDQPRPGKAQLQVVESAPDDVAIPDALGNEPQRERRVMLADKTKVEKFGEHEAAVPSEDPEVGPHGVNLPVAGEVAGGNIRKVLEAPPTMDQLATPLTKERAAMLKPTYQRIAGLVGRPPAEWGLIGPGERIRGHMLLLDLNTGEKVRAMDGHRVNEGELYANLRNLPESLSTGDTIARVLEAS